MADKTPLKATYSGSDTNGLAEFINTDTIGIADGGTGATTASAARTALGVSPTAGSSSLTTLGTIGTGVWEGTDVAVAHGGTGASTASAARTNLGITDTTPGGSNTQIQYNNSGAFGASANLTFDGTKLHVQSASAGTVTADSNADELVIEGSGNAGLTILSANTSQGNIAFGDDGNAKQGVFGFHQGNAEFNWSQATQQMVLDSSGRLGVGCNAPSSYQVNADSKAIVIGTGGTSGSPNVHLTLASDDTGNGRIAFTDTVDSTNQAYMRYDHNNANWDFTTTQSGGIFKFSPNTGGNSIMQIGDASSNLIVGVGNGAPSTDAMLTSQTSSNDHKVFHGKHTSSVATEPYGIQLDFTAASPDNNTRWFVKLDDSTATRGYWYSDGDVWTSDAGTLTSDERLKTNIVDASDKLADVMRLKVRNFEWTTDYHPAKGGEKKLGFIAQELETVFPSLITEHDIALDNKIEEELYKPQDEIPNGKEIGDVKVEAKAHEPTMRKAYKNAFAPILVKALQEVTVRLEAAEAKITALESA